MRSDNEYLQELQLRLLEKFKGDMSRANLWLNSNHYLLEGKSPMDLIVRGKVRQVLGFVITGGK
jgi:hypothetical protein